MTNYNILVVENDDAIREMLMFVLEKAGFKTTAATNLLQAQMAVDTEDFDLILLDWKLQDNNGINWANKLKKDPAHKNIPVIFSIARGEEDFIINGLDTNADDYVTKPFSPNELIARVRVALLRQGKNQRETQITIGDITLDTDQRRLGIGNQWLEVGPTRFRLMHFFMTHPDKAYTRTQLLDQIWGRKVYIEERTIDVHIRRLRQTLEEHGRKDLVQTVHGFGYRFSLAA